MDYSTLFQVANQIAMVGWILLILSPPMWRYTRGIIQWAIIPTLLCLLYAYLVFVAPGGGFSMEDFSSLEGVMRLFTTEKAVLAGWVHYLAFDLWVGSWEVADAHRRGINRLLVIPCLFFTFMLGPVGLLMYMILRGIMTRRVDHHNFISST